MASSPPPIFAAGGNNDAAHGSWPPSLGDEGHPVAGGDSFDGVDRLDGMGAFFLGAGAGDWLSHNGFRLYARCGLQLMHKQYGSRIN